MTGASYYFFFGPTKNFTLGLVYSPSDADVVATPCQTNATDWFVKGPIYNANEACGFYAYLYFLPI